MLVESDILPLPSGGKFCSAPGAPAFGARDAVIGLRAGETVFPADADTAEAIALRLEAAGDPGRAAWMRRPWADPAAATATAQESADEGEEPAVDVVEESAEVSEPALASPEPSEAFIAARELVDAAGDNLPMLRALAFRADAKITGNPKADKLRVQIFIGIAGREAAGLTPLRE